MNKLNKKDQDLLLEKIKAFFLDERDEEIGDLAADLYLDFIKEEIAAVFYNKGVQDAKQKLEENMARMTDDIECLKKIIKH